MDIKDMSSEQLYDFLSRLTSLRQAQGRGRTEESYQVRNYCKSEKKRIKAELRRRKLPVVRGEDKRVYGPGIAAWQRAGGAK